MEIPGGKVCQKYRTQMFLEYLGYWVLRLFYLEKWTRQLTTAVVI